MSRNQTHDQSKATATKQPHTQKAQEEPAQIRSTDYAALYSTTFRPLSLANVLPLQRIIGNRQVSQMLARTMSHKEAIDRSASRNTIQRNADAAQSYTPLPGQAMQQYFRNNHVPAPANYNLNTAIQIHGNRGAIANSTIISITNEEAAEEIETYLLGLNNMASNNLVNIQQITFTTAQTYPYIETALDNNNAPVFARAAIGHIRLRAQWNNGGGGFYQLYHCDGPV